MWAGWTWEDWCSHNPVAMWPWFTSVQGQVIRWVSLSNVLWRRLYPRAQKLWWGKQQWSTWHRVVHAEMCMCASQGKTTQYMSFCAPCWLEETWRHDMGAWSLKITCVLCLYRSVTLAGYGLLFFWLGCYIYKLSSIVVTYSFLQSLVAAEKQVKIAWPVV